MTSTQEELGKPIHSDEKNQKTTYRALYKVWRQAQREVERLFRRRQWELWTGSGEKNEFLRTLIQELVNAQEIEDGTYDLEKINKRE